MCYLMLMETAAASDPFVASLPVFARFESVADIDNYRPLPDGWALATADIVGSTKAIEAGRYKTVNMAGASVISALLNALGRQDLPFVFGGDGALVAFPGSALEITRAALAAVQRWVADELDLTLRAAIVPIKDIRAQGLDVRVARFQASEAVLYAMFAGGGGSWAEAEMKAGRYRIDPAPPPPPCPPPPAAGSDRPLLPLEPDRSPAWRNRLDHSRTGGVARPARFSVSGFRHHRPCRQAGTRWPPGAGERAGLQFSARRPRYRGAGHGTGRMAVAVEAVGSVPDDAYGCYG
jgi:hypothetical protein